MPSYRPPQSMRHTIYAVLCIVFLHSMSSYCLDADIVFVQAPRNATVDQPYNTSGRYVDGCRIVKLYRDGALQILTDDFVSACDPAVDFDGETIYFAGKRNGNEPWRIWKMNARGGAKTVIETGLPHSVSPLPVGNLFHLNDEHPAPRLVFVGAQAGWLQPVVNDSNALYACWLDGSGLQQITHNTFVDLDPAVLPNGRVVYSSDQQVGRTLPHYKLMAVNIDGADAMLYFGHKEPFSYLAHPAPSPDGRLYFADMGALSFVEQRRPQHTFKKLAKGRYHTPCPLDESSLIVSKKNGDGDLFTLLRLSAETGNYLETVYQSDEYHCIDAQVLAPHERVDGRSSVVNMEKTSGVLYCLNVYESQHGVLPDSVKSVRVIEGHSDAKPIGEAPVEKDGSFHLIVPADTPLSLQLLDGDGNALRAQCGWMWVRPGERRGCIGCHEDPELAPPNRLAQAVVKPAFDLTEASGKASIDFVNNILPLIKTTCSSCHDSTHRLDLSFDPGQSGHSAIEIYNELLKGRRNYVRPQSAATSPLVNFVRSKPHQIEVDDIQAIINWINQGAPYSISIGEMQ